MSKFSDVHFILKFLAFIVNLVAYIIYRTMEVEFIFSHTGSITPRSMLYAHTIPPYLIVMFVMVILYILNKPPGDLMCNVFLLVGAILSLALALTLFILYSKYHSNYYYETIDDSNYFTGSLIVGSLSIINCVLYIVDFVLYVKNCN